MAEQTDHCGGAGGGSGPAFSAAAAVWWLTANVAGDAEHRNITFFQAGIPVSPQLPSVEMEKMKPQQQFPVVFQGFSPSLPHLAPSEPADPRPAPLLLRFRLELSQRRSRGHRVGRTRRGRS